VNGALILRPETGGRAIYLRANPCQDLSQLMAIEKPIESSPEAVRSALAPLRNDFSIALFSPGNAFAVGAIIRVAHSYLAREIIIVGPGTWYAKASMGMHKYERIIRVPDVDALLGSLEGRPLWAVEKDNARISLDAVEKFPPEVVFAFGSERFGLPNALLEKADEIVGIPLYGVNHSLPVTVAAGIVMHEWARLKYSQGAVV
jgi:tRNA G18 (ribose-2'-O)-methylase SpoU